MHRYEPYEDDLRVGHRESLAWGASYVPFAGWGTGMYPGAVDPAVAAATYQADAGREPSRPRWRGPLNRPDEHQSWLERSAAALRDRLGARPKPSDYRRSDARLLEDVSEALTDDPNVDASELTVEVKDGEVTLRGRVANRWMKWCAEDVAEAVRGVHGVHNQLRVTRFEELND
jgi:hypothetical protein